MKHGMKNIKDYLIETNKLHIDYTWEIGNKIYNDEFKQIDFILA